MLVYLFYFIEKFNPIDYLLLPYFRRFEREQ